MRTTNRTLVDLGALPGLFPLGIARAAELIALGLTSESVYQRCRPEGPWSRLLPGVLLLANSPPTREQLVQAALRYAGTGAIVTGHDALRLHGMRKVRLGGPIHLLIPASRQVRSAPHVVIERTINPVTPVMRSGFPVAPLARCALDAARRLESLDETRALLSEVVQRGRISPNQLRLELNTGSRRGSALPRRVLGEIDDGIRSAAEAWARELIIRARLPRPQWNVEILGPDGDPLGVVDAWWDDVGMAWEIDSYEWHLSPDDYASTVNRGARLTAAGVTVVHTVPSRIRKEPKVVAAELRSALDHAAVRLRPPVSTRRRSC